MIEQIMLTKAFSIGFMIFISTVPIVALIGEIFKRRQKIEVKKGVPY